MLDLTEVSLCCVDTRDHDLALRAMNRSRENVRFAKSLFFTNSLPTRSVVAQGIDVHSIEPITSLEHYSAFVLKRLLPYIQTNYVLITQWDGYVVCPECWSAEFLNCDYLGAPWDNHDGTRSVGNGGFSIRSRRLLEALQDPRIVVGGNEDVAICGRYRSLLEGKYGVSYGAPEIAERFSFEMRYLAEMTFGFHGIFNLAFVESSANLVALAPHLSDRLLRDPFTVYLLLNCKAASKWNAIVAIGERILSLQPNTPVVATLVKQAREEIEARTNNQTSNWVRK